MLAVLLYSTLCGRNSLQLPLYGPGWSVPEEGFTWAVGDRSFIDLPDFQAQNLIVELTIQPCLRPGRPGSQRFHLRANGVAVGSCIISEKITLAFEITPLLPGPISLEIRAPDALMMNANLHEEADDRCLSFAIFRMQVFSVSETFLPALCSRDLSNSAALLMAFESVGHDCEFGLLQRQHGIEPLGLFRFSGQPHRLAIEAIHSQFEAFRDPASIEVTSAPPASEHIIFVRPYGMWFHTHIDQSSASVEQVAEQQRKRLLFLGRKFIEDVREASKIFVLKDDKLPCDAQSLAVFTTLSQFGPITMVCVRQADLHHPSGSLEVIRPGLYYGYITEFGIPGVALPRSSDDWLTLCRAAALLTMS